MAQSSAPVYPRGVCAKRILSLFDAFGGDGLTIDHLVENLPAFRPPTVVDSVAALTEDGWLRYRKRDGHYVRTAR